MCAGVVIDQLGRVTAKFVHRRRVLADHEPTDDFGGEVHLGVALAVAEQVARNSPPPAIAAGALTPTWERVARYAVAVEDVAHALVMTQTLSLVVGAFPPPGDVRASGADVLAVLDLATERRVAIGAEPRAAISWIILSETAGRCLKLTS